MFKILIIEDDEIVADIYQSKIESEGYEVRSSFDGEAGYQLIKEFKPDLVLLDMMMPGLTGADLLVLLRGHDEFTNLPIVAFTGSDSPEVFDEATRLGATKVFSKGDYTPDQIVARITAMLATLPQARGGGPEILHSLSEWTEQMWKQPLGRVLVVEDDPIIAELVKEVVEEEGYEAVTAEDGRDAYRILESDADFVCGIFDVNMPHIHGTDLVRHMRSGKRLLRMPVLIMTALDGLRVQKESLASGAELFLPKPFTRSTLRLMLHSLIAGKKPAKA
jgi:CheY-like chemotaxis protein